MRTLTAALQIALAIPRIDADVACGTVDGPVACFTADSLILTDQGLVRVADLKEGDLVLTRDRNLQPVRAINRRRFSNGAPSGAAPVLIRKGALGKTTPRADVVLSPGHMVLLCGPIAQRFGYNEVLVPASRLAQALDDVSVLRGQAEVEYFHIMFDRTELVMCDGYWSECFRDTVQAQAGVSGESRREVLKFFPELDASFTPEPDVLTQADAVESLDWAHIIDSNIRSVLGAGTAAKVS